MEFLERLECDDDVTERWLVQADPARAPHVWWLLRHEDAGWLDAIEQATRAWHGPIHPRVTEIFTSRRYGDRLLVEIEDDRGPYLRTAARQLTDPLERERWVVAQFIAIGEGLAALRRRDPAYVHRQLEPGRLYVDVQGHARLRAPIPALLQGERPARMGAGVVHGVPSFMSPEQVAGTRGCTAASDVFSLAVNLYEALADRLPFPGDTLMEQMVAIVRTPAPPLPLHTPKLQRVLERALAKDASVRTPDPGTFADELGQCCPDARDDDEVLSDRLVAWRAATPWEPAYAPTFAGTRCRMTWDQLHPTAQADVRHCSGCRQDVVRVRSLAAIVPLLGERCVAYTGGD